MCHLVTMARPPTHPPQPVLRDTFHFPKYKFFFLDYKQLKTENYYSKKVQKMSRDIIVD